MPCTGCSNPEYKGTVKLRYTGGPGDWGGHSFLTGRIYTMPARYANRKAYPLFELVAVMPGTVIPEKYRYVKKRVEAPVEVVQVPVEEEEVVPELDEPIEVKENIDSTEVKRPWDSRVYEEDAVVEVGEYASSIKDATSGFTRSDMIAGMDSVTLKAYIESMGGKVDNRWGLERLIEEAQKLQ